MKFHQFLQFLPWLLVLTLAESPPPHTDPPMDIHPDDLMKREGQYMCLENDPLNMDLLLRHETTLLLYPEVKVGCETISRKPLKTHHNSAAKQDNILNEKVRKFFVIDAHGVEHQTGPDEPVVIETYTSGVLSEMIPDYARATTQRPFNFDQVCFPLPCYERSQDYDRVCQKDFMSAYVDAQINYEFQCESRLEAAEQEEVDCTDLPHDIREWRKYITTHTGPSHWKPDTSVYCIGDGPSLGPIRTPKYPAGQIFMSGRKVRHYVLTFDTIHERNPWNPLKVRIKEGGSKFSFSYANYADVEGQRFIIGCAAYVPLEAPVNNTVGMHYLISRGPANMDISPLTVQKGDRIDLRKLYGAHEPGSKGPEQIVRFEDLCFPSECRGRAPEDYKCKGKYPLILEGNWDMLPTLTFDDHDESHSKQIWPYNSELLTRGLKAYSTG